MKLSYNRFFFYIFIIISIFFLDRLSKLYVLNYASANEQVNIVVNDFLNIILIWNKGIGFGLFSFDNNKVYNFITFLILTINLLIIYLIIKSDIEGSEVNLVEELPEIIEKYRPQLAISIYHVDKSKFPEIIQLVSLPKKIINMCKNYNFFLKHYSHNRRETVFYAIPR